MLSLKNLRFSRPAPGAWALRLLLALGVGCAGAGAGAAATSAPVKIEYNRDIRPVLSEHCYACHGPDERKRKAGLREGFGCAFIAVHHGEHQHDLAAGLAQGGRADLDDPEGLMNARKLLHCYILIDSFSSNYVAPSEQSRVTNCEKSKC